MVKTTETKTILVTGATAGIGRHLVLELARKGFHVFATGRKEAALEELAREVRANAAAAGSPVAIETLRLDVTDRASIAEAAARVDEVTKGRGLDVLVNNAGYGCAGPLEEISDEDLRAQFETNVFGLMAVTRAFLPAMRARGSGRILNVGSIAGRLTFPLFGAYHASKYAVEALSDALRNELAPFGIQVVIIEPGPIQSEFADRTVRSVVERRNDSSPFAPIFARVDEFKRRSNAAAAGPEKVARAVEHAITARRPHARYVVPFTSRLLVWAFPLLPTRVADAILRQIAGLTPRKLGKRREPTPELISA
jgi:short-subunit dehydrogenase